MGREGGAKDGKRGADRGDEGSVDILEIRAGKEMGFDMP